MMSPLATCATIDDTVDIHYPTTVHAITHDLICTPTQHVNNDSSQFGIRVCRRTSSSVSTRTTAEPYVLQGYTDAVTALAISTSSPRPSCWMFRSLQSYSGTSMKHWTILDEMKQEESLHDDDDTQRIMPCGRVLPIQYPIHKCAISPSADYIAVASNRTVMVISVETAQVVAQLQGHTSSITAIQFLSHNPQLLLTASHDRTFKLWSLTALSLLYDSSILNAPIMELSVHPTSNRFAIGMSDGTVRLYEIRFDASNHTTTHCRLINTRSMSATVEQIKADAATIKLNEQKRKALEQSKRIVRADRRHSPIMLTNNQPANDEVDTDIEDNDDIDGDELNKHIIIGLYFITIQPATTAKSPADLRSTDDSYDEKEQLKPAALSLPLESPKRSLMQTTAAKSKQSLKQNSKLQTRQLKPSNKSIEQSPPRSRTNSVVIAAEGLRSVDEQYSLIIVTPQTLSVISLRTLALTHHHTFIQPQNSSQR